MNIKEISNRLDQAMRAADVRSQSELSRRSGVPQPTINRILKGAGSQGPETATLAKLSVALNVDLRWLQEGVGDKPGDETPRKKGGEAANTSPSSQSLEQQRSPEGERILENAIELLSVYSQANERERRHIEGAVADVREMMSKRIAINHS